MTSYSIVTKRLGIYAQMQRSWRHYFFHLIILTVVLRAVCQCWCSPRSVSVAASAHSAWCERFDLQSTTLPEQDQGSNWHCERRQRRQSRPFPAGWCQEVAHGCCRHSSAPDSSYRLDKRKIFEGLTDKKMEIYLPAAEELQLADHSWVTCRIQNLCMSWN